MTIRTLLSALLAGLTMASCAVYVPQTADIPHLTQQGDMQGSLSLDMANAAFALSLSGAPTHHLGLMLSGSLSMDEQPNTTLRPAVGYYHSWNNRLMLATYVSADWRHRHYTDIDRQEWLDYHTTTLFGQVDFVWAPAPWFDLCSRLSIGNLHHTGTRTALLPDGTTSTSPRLGNNLIIEPTLQLRVGSQNLKFYLSGTFAELCASPSQGKPAFAPFTLGIGLNYRFNPFRK